MSTWKPTTHHHHDHAAGVTVEPATVNAILTDLALAEWFDARTAGAQRSGLVRAQEIVRRRAGIDRPLAA